MDWGTRLQPDMLSVRDNYFFRSSHVPVVIDRGRGTPDTCLSMLMIWGESDWVCLIGCGLAVVLFERSASV